MNDYNPFEPEQTCSNPACRSGRIRVLSCGPVSVSRPLDLGTPDKPGPDLRISWAACEECRKSCP